MLFVFCVRLMVCLMLLATAACASRAGGGLTGDVNSGLLIPMGASRYEMKENEIFLVADKLPGQPEPAYPAQYLTAPIGTQVVCVDVVVNGDGMLAEADVNRTDPACLGEQGFDGVPIFEKAALDAVSKWQFWGAQLCRFPPSVASNDQCEGEGVEIVPIPIRLTYIFEFTQQDGKPVVNQRK